MSSQAIRQHLHAGPEGIGFVSVRLCLSQVNPEKRLGSGPGGASDIKKHKWFSRIDWKLLEARKLPTPIRPKVGLNGCRSAGVSCLASMQSRLGSCCLPCGLQGVLSHTVVYQAACEPCWRDCDGHPDRDVKIM